MNGTIEKFISLDFASFDMAKDSELVKEVEDFLKEKGIGILEMEYSRDWKYNKEPTFEILTKNNGVLEKLSDEMKIPLRKDYDERSWYKVLSVKNSNYNLSVYARKKF